MSDTPPISPPPMSPPYPPQPPTPPGYSGQPAGLEYASPAFRKPGVITTLGILSIIFGGIGALSNLLGVVSTILALTVGNPFAPGAATTTTTFAGGPPAVVQGTSVAARFGGSLDIPDAAEAQIIVDGLHDASPFSPEFDEALLAALQAGAAPIAPPADGVWTRQHVATGVMPTTGDQRTDATTFEFADGRIVLVSGDGDTPTSIEMLVYESAFDRSTVIDLAADGSATQTTLVVGPPNAMAMAMVQSPGQMWFNLISGTIFAGLAILLVVAGIGLLKSRAWARVWHLRWAVTKIVVLIISSVISAFLMAKMMGSMMTAMPGNARGTPQVATAMQVGVYFGTFCWLLFLIAYPIVVLVLLRRPVVRDYLEGIVDPEQA